VLRWFHAGTIDEFPFAGEAFHPTAQSPDGPIQFELVAHGSSRSMLLDLSTRKAIAAPPSTQTNALVPGISPNGKWIVFTSSLKTSEQIWLRGIDSGRTVPITHGNCNSVSPVWELDSRAIVFASDCGRGIGLPALYRARLDQLEKLH
jgi:Tol biopolymer transport system component